MPVGAAVTDMLSYYHICSFIWNCTTSLAIVERLRLNLTCYLQEQSQPSVAQGEGETEDPILDTDMLIKHPLQNQWTLWFFKPDRAKGWEENQREVIHFDTIEDFWS